jgi:hypothetical protein
MHTRENAQTVVLTALSSCSTPECDVSLPYLRGSPRCLRDISGPPELKLSELQKTSTLSLGPERDQVQRVPISGHALGWVEDVPKCTSSTPAPGPLQLHCSKCHRTRAHATAFGPGRCSPHQMRPDPNMCDHFNSSRNFNYTFKFNFNLTSSSTSSCDAPKRSS